MDKPLHGMTRRRFLGLAASMAQLGCQASPAMQEAGSRQGIPNPGNAPPKYTYWMHGLETTDLKGAARALKAAGFTVVVANGAAAREAINQAGMECWVCGGAFGIGRSKDDEMFRAIDVTGKPQIWFGSGCPNNKLRRERNLRAYEQMAAQKDIVGVLVDGCRFASPAAGLAAFLTCFCGTCRGKAERLGFRFDIMQRDVMALYGAVTGLRHGTARRSLTWLQTPMGFAEWLANHPGILEWLRFRRNCVTEHFRVISGVLQGAGCQMGVYVFTPSLAPLVGQSYGDLCEFADVLAPMIYRNYPDRPGEACLNWELTIIPEELGLDGTPAERDVMNLILTFTGLHTTVPNRTIKAVRAGLPPRAVADQVALARTLIGTRKKLVPIIHINDPLMKQTAALVRGSGADSINFFSYRENWLDLVQPAWDGA